MKRREMNLIMDNVKVGIVHQYELSGDAACEGDLELASEHWKAAELLEEIYFGYIPVFEDEL